MNGVCREERREHLEENLFGESVPKTSKVWGEVNHPRAVAFIFHFSNLYCALLVAKKEERSELVGGFWVFKFDGPGSRPYRFK